MKVYAYQMTLMTGEVVSTGIVGMLNSPDVNEIINGIVRAAVNAGTVSVDDVVDVMLTYAVDNDDDPTIITRELADLEFLTACGIEVKHADTVSVAGELLGEMVKDHQGY